MSVQPIAIIGLGLRLPRARTLAQFWEHLAAGRSLITEVSPRRWDPAELHGDPRSGNRTASIWGGFLDDADCFDAPFFSISPREAAWMDPQQRFALEMAWHAIEDAGYRAAALAGSRTGVYMGVCHWDYAELLEKQLAEVDAYTPTGIAFSIIANRISHYFDLRGPSIANDTACAASLTSVYEAVRALQNGECEQALAGGVNLAWSPNHFVAFSKAGMLSRDGRSKAFDERADGYVRGEGGAMLLLKPLDAALADGDPIHAVIRAIGVNHGGRTSSLTVTNPQAQAELISGVFREAGVSPAQVSYIEAHGPGTPLGDPIEIAGLKQAFAELYAEAGLAPAPESCGIGSVKTNIGHLEGAAGVAGMVKVVAALGHDQLPANVDFQGLNSLIDLSGSPFRIQGQATPWPRQGERLAGVSSFGFGGSNAHVLLADGPAVEAGAEHAGPVVVPLSAKEPERLVEYARELLAFVARRPAGLRLVDLAYTLQVGREEMESRLALVAEDWEGLEAALAAFVAETDLSPPVGAAPPPRFFVQGHRGEGAVPTEEETADQFAAAAARWVNGEPVDWRAVHPAARRIHAPVYPFASHRYWMDDALAAKDGERVPHPLLHRNLSGFHGQRFRARLKGGEFYWAEHHVGERQILPGVTYLEMARAAWQQANDPQAPMAPVVLENVAWTRPIVAGEAPVSVDVALTRQADGRVEFVIESGGLSHGQGSLLPLETPAPVHDLAALTQAAAQAVDVAYGYRRLRESGMRHGPSFQAMSQLRRGEGFVLAQLKLGRLLQPGLGSLPLHPILLDAAIQAWIGMDDAVPERAAVPFACRRIECYGPCEPLMWAYVRPIASAPGLIRLDIDLCDKAGQVRVAFRDLALRPMAAEAPAAMASDSLRVAAGQWRPQPLVQGGGARDTLVVLAGLEAELAGYQTLRLEGEGDAATLAQAWFTTLHRRLAQLMAARPRNPQQILVLAPAALDGCLSAPLAALLKTAALENPKFEGAVIAIDGPLTPARLTRLLDGEGRRADRYAELRYDAHDNRSAWRPQAVALPEASAPALDPEAAYWITGGLGGLGLLFADWLARRGARRLVLSGRRDAPDTAAAQRLERLRAQGVDACYAPCDLADPEQTASLAAWIADTVGPLKGVIHAAGVLDDGFIFNKDPAGIPAVFAPKAAGALNLDAATQDAPLDFLLLCSSVAAVFGNPGQADYAGANAFLSAFAERRAEQVARGERRGLTLALEWPLWAEGGMGVDAASLKALHARFGTVPLPTTAGLDVLERLLAAGATPRRTVLHGDPEPMDALLADYGAGPAAEAPAAAAPAPAATGDLEARTLSWLRELVADATQLDPARIRPNRKLEEYGLDSILIVELTTRLEQRLGSLSKTLFFEYVDLAGVAGYLIEEHRDALLAALAEEAGLAEAPAAPTAPASQPLEIAAPAVASAVSRAEPAADDRHDIAIVGLSLQVARAADQEAFWDMLSQGLHGFQAYPAERWNHDALLHPERDVLGKTVVRTGAFLDNVDRFDPRYFRISQYEAELMSPEVRLFLQASVEAFEDAGYSREYLQRRYGGDVAVIVGSMTNEYDLFGFQNMLMRGALASGSYTGTVPNMVSYFYGLTGPSYFLDTMCSASSTCVHEAVHMLRAGRCRMALAGGVSLLLHPQKLIATSQEHFTSKTADVIRGYGLGADGTILGEGVGALVLKTLSDAERDGDHIYGVIRGSGISNAGVRNGFTVPNPHQQAAAIASALEDAGVDARDIGYIEGHGSGTALGDPIEVKALTQVFRKYSADTGYCPIGTVKSNVAHLLAASGLAGIAKVLMQLKHGQLAPSLHADTLNPNIPFEQTPFYVQRELAPWPRRRGADGRERPRLAGVTSIGAGGMNSHILIQEHLPAPRPAQPGGPELLVFSAMTEAALQRLLERMLGFLGKTPAPSLADLAWTLQVGRNELPCRLAFVAADLAEARARLERFLAAPDSAGEWHYVRNILELDPETDPEALQAQTRGRELAAVGRAWASGLAVDWDLLHQGRQPRRVSLPAYPFEQVRCWYPEYPDAPSVVKPLGNALKLHPLVGANHSDLHGLRYRTAIHLNELLDYSYRRERVQQLLPTVALEALAALGAIAGLDGPLAVKELTLDAAPDWQRVAELEAELSPEADGLWVRLNTLDGAGQASAWARGRVSPAVWRADLPTLELPPTAPLEAEDIAKALAALGLDFAPYLEVMERAWRLPGGGLFCELRLEHPRQDFFKRNVQLPPAALAGLFQALALSAGAEPVLAAVERLALGEGQIRRLLLTPAADGRYEADFLAADGTVVARLQGLALAGAQTLEQAPQAAPAAQGSEAERLSLELRALAAELLKFPAEAVNPRELFHELGFDSISLTRLATAIGERYGISLSPAVFFECEHLEALSRHLLERHQVRPAAAAPRPAVPQAAALAKAPTAAVQRAPAPAAAPPSDAVAIVGLAARLPGADSADAFFQRLLAGDDLTGELPLERYGAAYRARIEAADFPRRGGFLSDIDRFDAAHFRISPLEAARLDPQQRLMLETVWRALEHAGYRPDELPRDTGVYVGVSALDYAELLRAHGVDCDGYVATGNSLAMVANRVSHFLDLHGPSQAIDTACSSSLIALLRAAEAVRGGRCGAAIVGGVNLALSLEGFVGPHQAGMLSPEGRCKSFGAGADGYARGEGVAALLLKPLGQAQADGDRILGLLIGGAENHGGRAGSLTAPNAKAQAELVQRAMAGIDAASVGYIEAHGTGTALGDPVELNGLNLAYRALLGGRAPAAPIALGSVKSNIGHLEAAAGLAGVVKVLLAMEQGELPASLHCRPPNPHLELGEGPFRLLSERQAWQRPVVDGREQPRRAGVSSFGFGGANAHVVLEEYRGGEAPRRRPLPPRQFADTRFWLPASSGATLLLRPDWRDAPLVAAAGAPARRLVVACGLPAPAGVRTLSAPAQGDIGARYGAVAGQLLDALKQALSTGDGPLLVQLVAPLEGEEAIFAGLGALLDSAEAENPLLRGQVIQLDSAAGLDGVLQAEAGALERRVRYRNGRRQVRHWAELPATSTSPWRPRGVTLISGGMGGLGRLLARHCAAPGAVLVLTGSRALDAEREAFLASLRERGTVAEYRQVDIADPAAVTALVGEITARHGGLHSVIHCAGVLRDGWLLHKSRADLEAVLAPKVGGLLALWQACRPLRLERFVLFSSLAGAVGNPGQADYAAANGFLDAFAETHGGPLLALDWPLWRDGGMSVDAQVEAELYRRMGQRPLTTDQGLAALAGALASGQSRVAVVAGEAESIRRFFAASVAAPAPVAAPAAASDEALRAGVTQALTALFARVSGTPAQALQPQAPLSDYGIDSLMITRLNHELGDVFGPLSKTLLFEHRTLAALAAHLTSAHADACRRWTGVAATSAPISLPAPVPALAAAKASRPTADAPIAIIGLSGRYPGAPDLASFWANLAAGRDSITEVPAERWPLEGFFHPDPDEAVARGLSYAKWGGFLEGFADFDPLFFKLSPRDAAAMDPQERLFLQSAWAACEDAGYSRARLARRHGGRVGVFAGVTKTGFALHGPFETEGGARVRPQTSFASVANRVSHLLDLNGPSVPVDTMCSSSLTAIHQACESLRAGDCELALAGGVNLYLHPSSYVELSAARMLSSDGRCKSFGAGGNGFVPGEGVGVVLLKPLDRALADGDPIHGVIRASAVNHGGRTNGYTVPNPAAQGEVVRAALTLAGLSPRDLSYIEAHGTGTELGDPIELTGLTQAFDSSERGFCALGSVKSAIGHLEAAAGIAGVTKVLLQFKHRQLAPSLHADELNPNLDFDATPFVLQRRLAPWTAPRRIAGVSSFGAGGANAHVILEEWEAPAAAADDGALQVIPVSARNPDRLRAQAAQLLAFLEPAAAAPAALEAELRQWLAEALAVAVDDIDPAESFDSYGVSPAQRLALAGWLRQRLGREPAPDLLGPDSSLARLAAALGGAGASQPPRLADIAYTLQVGREPMAARLGLKAASLDELRAGLRAYLEGRDHPGLFQGEKGADGLTGLDSEDLAELAGRWLDQGRADKLLALWVQGLALDWEALPRPAGARMVSLPTYPFARERYWLPTAGADPLARAVAQVAPAAEAETLAAANDALERRLAALLRPLLAQPVIEEFQRWQEAARALVQRYPAEGGDPWAEWEAYKQRLAAQGAPLAQATLAETTLRALPEILAGRRKPTEVMFPAGGLSLVEGVYKQNPVASRFNRALAAAAAAFVARRRAAEPGRALRILEIGAGTGGTTEPVLAALAQHPGAIAEYRYTDVSRAFLIHAQRRYAQQAPWLTTALFDVERPLAGQEVEAGGFDLVIAANVLHATADMAATLAVVRDTLAPGGLLLINETSAATVFTHVTFGLLEGWWRFTDPARRIPGTPSLSPASWREVLEGVGLRWRAGSPDAELALGQQIIAAAAPEGARAQPLARPRPQPAVVSAPAPAAAAGSLRDLLLKLLGETLNVAPASIAVNQSFADYGLDSILGAELVHKLRRTLGIELEQIRLFDHGSVAALEAMLQAEFPRAVAALGAPAAAGPEAPVAPAVISAALAPQAATPRDKGPIAIVGASGRFAGSATVDELWAHLVAGRDLVEPVSRFDLDVHFKDLPPGSYGRHGSFIDGVDRFDPVFFGISGLEATYMDPQQRLFLEEAWKTLENAGHGGEAMVGSRCGVFVGASAGDYHELFRRQPPGQAFWGNTSSLIPARIAYCLDLKGPALAVDTACSSSLVAVHLACQSLWAGECDMALAGGVFVQATARFYRSANAARMLSPSGRCAAFGQGADGIVPGEAVAAVLLRPLADALADGDTIHGVIVASGTNQDGTTNGITAPSAVSQERLIRGLYQDFGIDPAEIGLVEAHGTGTPLGDPIEHAALTRAFGARTDQRGYCALGSVKSNIGHATTAAGVAGLIKVLLSLRHRRIPPTLHFGQGNPAIRFADSPFFVNSEAVDWPAPPSGRRRAAVSSFGFSGTNAHVVVEQPPQAQPRGAALPAALVVLSARSVEQLRRQAENLVAHLAAEPAQDLADVAYTLLAGRRHFHHRLALVVRDREELSRRLSAWLAGEAGVACAELDEKDQREDAARSAEGRALIERLGEGPADQAWIQGLEALADCYLAGCRLAYEQVLRPGERRRVPLPTYPFAARRYWVEDGAAEPVKPASVAMPKPVERAVVSVRPSGAVTRLEDPAALAPVAAPAPRPPVNITLAPLVAEAANPRRSGAPAAILRADAKGNRGGGAAPTGEGVDAKAQIRLVDEDGVRRLTLTGACSPELESALAQELAVTVEDPELRVVLVTGAVAGCGGSAARAARDCALPVVVAVADGAVSELAREADFAVPVAQMEPSPAESGILGSQDLDSAALHPGYGAAWELARQIAQAPRISLVELKRHMRGMELPAAADDTLAQAAVAAPAPGAPRRIPLKTPVMELEAYDDGVVVLRMCERQHKNTFTPAFMAGMTEAFELIGRTPEFKVVVLTGHDGYFACGGTRDGLQELQRGATRFTDLKIYSLPLECPLPVIGALQGHAIGAGWSLGMFCDLRLFSADSVYHSNYLWYGFTPGAGATLIFPHRLGESLGREVLFSAREYKGRELAARRPDLTALPAAQVLPQALALAHGLAAKPRDWLLRAKADQAAPLLQRLERVFAQELAMHEKTFIDNPRVMERIQQAFPQAPAPAAPAPAADGRQAVRAQLVQSLAEELMIPAGEIRDGASFLELGLDSILAVTWIRRLNALFKLELPATAVYAHPTVGALVAHVAGLAPAQPAAPRPAVSEPAPAQPAPVASQPQVSAPPAVAAADAGRVRRELVQSLAEELMLPPDEIRDGASFLELGLDSILAVTWIRRLNGLFGLELPATAVYAHPTVGALVAHVAGLVPPAPATPAAPPVVEPVVEPVALETPPPAAPAVHAPIAAEPAARPAPAAIAIIGASGRYPKAADLEAFWANIRAGRDCIDEVPPQRWDIARHYDPDPQAPDASYCKWMGAIDQVERFDPLFFNITPREAELMDPQQRLFLEHAWHAMEDAALDPYRLAGSACGVFVGAGPSGYAELIEERNAYSLLGSAGSILAARIAHLLDFRGPAVALDTACSTSLVAIAEACNSLLLGDCDLALAGGACVLVGPSMFIDTSKVNMLSKDGRCFTFDQRANGFVPGEGVGVLLLKRLEDAQRDGDPIRAVIRGWGVNQDGKTNGITAPNPQAQTRLMSKVYERFGIDPASIGLVECHGTGTPLGDPIEIEGLRDAFGDAARRGGACALGSVKANVGHLLAAAGVAGATKAMLALEQAELPPLANFQSRNAHIDLKGTPFQVNTALKPWAAPAAGRRRAAVSAFGFSGTNAHLVLEEHPPAPAGAIPGPWLFTLSARDAERLRDYAGRIQDFVAARPELDLGDLAHTLRVARSAFGQRLAFVYRNREELLAALASVIAGQPAAGVHSGGRDADALALFEGDPETAALPGRWLRSGSAESLEKLARLWAKGLEVDWIGAGSRGTRIRLPGYPFAPESYWITPAPTAAPAPVAAPRPEARLAIEKVAPGRYGVELPPELPVALSLPELARVAVEREGLPLRGLKRLLWGKGPARDDAGRRLELTLASDSAGSYFHVCPEDDAGSPWLLGELLAEADAAYWPAPLDGQPQGEEVTAEFRRQADGEPLVERVWRQGEALLARLRRTTSGPGLDPQCLRAAWSLLGFQAGEGLCPYAVETLVQDGPLPTELLLRVWRRHGDTLTLEFYGRDGAPRLVLDGVLARPPQAVAEIRFQEELLG